MVMNIAQYSNVGRQTELDIARGLAIIFMVLIHCVEYFYNGEDSVFFKVANFLGSPPAAPVFMFILGCGIIYSRHNSPQLLFRRGILLFLLSYVFNALVYVAPYFIYSVLHSEPEFFEENWTQIYDADILQFAGLAFMFFALTKSLNLKSFGYIVLGVILAGIGMYLNAEFAEFESDLMLGVTGLFWGTHEGSYFPFLCWIPYPIAGYIFAEILRETHPDDKAKFYKKISIISGIIFVVAAVVLAQFYEWDEMMDGDIYYHQNIFLHIMFIAFILMWIGILYAISSYLANFIMSFLKTLSVHVTLFYCLQYFFIIYIQVLIFGDNPEWGMMPTLLMFIGVTIASYLATLAYKKLRKA